MNLSMNGKEIVEKVLAEAGRILIGVVFIFSGFVKAVDPMGGAIKIDDYLKAFGLDFLHIFSVTLSMNLAAFEFMLGVCMLLGVYRRYTSFLTLVFMLFMTPLTLYLALFKPVSDCGCFGDALVLTNWETFLKNVVLLSAAIYTFVYNQKLYQLYTYKVYWFVALFSYLYMLLFANINYNHLPVIDFRPFKVGVNIPSQMEIPEGAPQDEYEYSFIYEKDGVQKEFTLDNYPSNDSSWVFVDSKTTLIKQGYVPPISNFSVTTLDGVDVTDSLLSDSRALFLLIAPDLKKASDERIDEINNVFDFTQEYDNLGFYCITGSTEDEINKWIDYTGAEYSFLFADEVVLKTIIRSNPGLVLIKDGTILAKWHYNDIPDEQVLDALTKSYLAGNKQNIKEEAELLTNLLTFTVPLLLVWMYDLLRFRRKRKEKK